MCLETSLKFTTNSINLIVVIPEPVRNVNLRWYLACIITIWIVSSNRQGNYPILYYTCYILIFPIVNYFVIWSRICYNLVLQMNSTRIIQNISQSRDGFQFTRGKIGAIPSYQVFTSVSCMIYWPLKRVILLTALHTTYRFNLQSFVWNLRFGNRSSLHTSASFLKWNGTPYITDIKQTIVDLLFYIVLIVHCWFVYIAVMMLMVIWIVKIIWKRWLQVRWSRRIQ